VGAGVAVGAGEGESVGAGEGVSVGAGKEEVRQQVQRFNGTFWACLWVQAKRKGVRLWKTP